MTLRIVDTVWPEARQMIEHLRREVFILEQQVPEELEWDNADFDAKHFCLLESNELVAYGRLLLKSADQGKLTRMAVQRNRRRQGLGNMLLLHAMGYARQIGLNKLKLDAQLHVVQFYRKQGFIPEGAVFWDAGIEHITMGLTL